MGQCAQMVSERPHHREHREFYFHILILKDSSSVLSVSSVVQGIDHRPYIRSMLIPAESPKTSTSTVVATLTVALPLARAIFACSKPSSACVGLPKRYSAESDAAGSEERRVGKECRSRWSPY